MTLQKIALKDLYASRFNPRQHYDPASLTNLGASMKDNGQWNPIVVRARKGGGWEIGAGERRWRSAKVAGMTELDAVVREMTDEQFLELLVFENPEHSPLHPLEEARGYKMMMENLTGYDLPKLAGKAKRSVDFIRERLRLLKLSKAAQELFLDGTITLTHANMLARLSLADQARAIDPQAGGLFEADTARLDESMQALEEPHAGRKVRSPRELATWIARSVRFDPATIAAATLTELWPATAEDLKRAAEEDIKVVLITRDASVAPEAKGEGGTRIFGPASWTRADDQEDYDYQAGRRKKARPCDSAILGVVAVGPGQSESFAVCVDKKHCRIHWKPAAAPKAGATHDKALAAEQLRVNKQVEAQKAHAAAKRRYEAARPAILAELAGVVKKATASSKGPLGEILVKHLLSGSRSPTLVPIGRNAEDLVRHLAFAALEQESKAWGAEETFTRTAKRLGVDIHAILKDVDAKQAKADKATAPAKPPK